ncbi:lysophospholipid acyltransferase family protein [Silvimonas sp. JCM 19000]
MVLLRSLIYWLGFVLITPVYAILSLMALPFPRVPRYRFVTGWCKIMVFLLRVVCGLHYKVIGRENILKQPAMLMSKHQSAWETMALTQFFPPLVYVLKRELFKIPFFGWGLRVVSPIAIDRSNRAEAQRLLMEQGHERLRDGFWIGIFPEGTRVAPGKRAQYKQGGARLAISLGVPIVPVALNSGEYWPKNSLKKYPGTITVSIGPAIQTAGRSADEITREVENWIETELARIGGTGPCYPRA